MYQLAISRDFIARHFLVGGDWGDENDLHSHHYRIEVSIESGTLNEHGYLIDIVDLEQALNQTIAEFRECILNELGPFQDLNPSLEHFCRILFESLLQKIPLAAETVTLKLWENETDWAAYRSDR